MQNIMKTSPVWLFLLLVSLSIFAQPAGYLKYLGVYEGLVLETGRLSPMVVTFKLLSDGRLRGEYEIDGVAGPFSGILSNPQFLEENVVTFEWRDKDGEGYQEIQFSDDYSSFRGYWANYGEPQQFFMNGVRK